MDPCSIAGDAHQGVADAAAPYAPDDDKAWSASPTGSLASSGSCEVTATTSWGSEASDPRRLSLETAAAAYGGYEGLARAAKAAAAAPCRSTHTGGSLQDAQLMSWGVQHAMALQAMAAQAYAVQMAVASRVPAQSAPSGGGALNDVVLSASDQDRHTSVIDLLEEGSAGVVAELEGNILWLSFDRFGCRVVQKALETTTGDAQLRLAMKLRGSVLKCAEHMHGNFVLQKCVEQLPLADLRFILEELQGHISEVATHTYACRVVQRLFERCPPLQLRNLSGRILRITGKLARDAYGSLVLRHILEFGGMCERRRIIAAMAANTSQIARHRYSSLVLETAVQVASRSPELERDRASLMLALLGSGGEDKRSVLQGIATDRYGNYVAQRVIECSCGGERQALQVQVQSMESELRQSATGRHILATLRRHGGAKSQGGVVGGA